jgi:hypothetical protein
VPHAPRQEYHLEGVQQHDGHQHCGSNRPDPSHGKPLRFIRRARRTKPITGARQLRNPRFGPYRKREKRREFAVPI